MADNLGAINWSYEGDLTKPDPDTPRSPAPMDMYAYLVGQGANRNEALMLTGAAASESELDPTATHDGGVGYGMFGHNGSRLLGMKQYAASTGSSLDNWQTQADYALKELRSRPEGAAVANATTPEQLALGQMYFERPQGFSTDNPQNGHNFTGRLNTLKKFTALDPSASGNFSPSANPQVSPSMLFPTSTTGINPLPTVGMPALTGTQAPATTTAASASNPMANVGNTQLNNALHKLVSQSLQPSGAAGSATANTPIVAQLLGHITQPIHQGLQSALTNLFGGGSSAAPAAPQPAAPVSTPPNGQAPQLPTTAEAPVTGPAQQSAVDPSMGPMMPQSMAPGPQQGPPIPQQPAAAAAAAPQQNNFLSALAGLFGGGGGA